MKNFKVMLLYLLVGYILPLLPKLELIGHYKILTLMASCIIMLLWANPPINFSEGKQKKSSDKGTMLLIFILSYVAILTPILEWAYFKTDNGWTTMTTVGFILIIGGLWFRIWSLQILGKYFTGTVKQVEGHQLVTSGPYKWLRHPSYLGSWITFLGCAVFLEAWVGMFITALAMGIAYYFRIRVEEKFLINAFGQDYRNYQKCSYRLVPYVW